MKRFLLSSALLMTILLIQACSGSPARTSMQTIEEVYLEKYVYKSIEQMCAAHQKTSTDGRTTQYAGWASKLNAAQDIRFSSLGASADDCNDLTAYYSRQGWDQKKYQIDGLMVIKKSARVPLARCNSGNLHVITLRGMIGPDSSFTLEKLLEESLPCSDSAGNVFKPVTVNLESGGGLLEDGYSLGKTLRKFRAKTVISDDKTCASSCAVAFLGGETRVVSDQGTILFHAPYFNRVNMLGNVDPDCEVGEAELLGMENYYEEMTSNAVATRLFDRTMRYCSAEDGWTITGGDAAQLYGIATQDISPIITSLHLENSPNITNQNLDNISQLYKGMSKKIVQKTMGPEIYTEKFSDGTEIHYCKTGMGKDEFAALYFVDDILLSKQKYTVNWRDVNYLTGSCENFVKMGSYEKPTKF